MPRTISEIRRSDRDRKRRQRAAAAEAGVPSSAQVNIALIEAICFCASSGVNIAAAKTGREPSLGLSEVFAVAQRILVERLHFDGEASRAGILKALAPRPEHRWPSYVPTHATMTPGHPAA